MNRRMILLGIPTACLFVSSGFAEPVTVATTETPAAFDTVYVNQSPPAPKVETSPPAPGPNAVWIAGHWKWQVNKYIWVAGQWDKTPQGQWVPGRWQKRPRGYVWVAGHWAKKAPKAHKRWIKGHWSKHKGTQVWVAGHWEP